MNRMLKTGTPALQRATHTAEDTRGRGPCKGGEKARRSALSAPSPAYGIRGSHRPHPSSRPDVARLLLEGDGDGPLLYCLGIKHQIRQQP
eukprot:scaffold4156_cov101-Isochrysis_galbana.AAC.2